MMLRRVDAFDEFAHIADLGSVADATRSTPLPNEARIVEYLISAPIVMDIMERHDDVIDGSPVEATGSLCTDGEWYWREDLAHYVARHHLELPREFTDHLEHRNYKLVRLSDERLMSVTQELLQLWSE